MMINFGIRLKALRKERKRTQENVAKFLNVKRATYSGYERGVIMPPYEKIAKLAEYFGTTIDYLMDKKPEAEPPTDVSRSINDLLSKLKNKDSPIVIDGVQLDEESRELLISSLDSSLKMSKIISKRSENR